jgi:hypothetical protein
MTDPKNEDKKEKKPYEPPRLFDLGGGVAYAAAECKPGGSPSGECKEGSMATSSKCTDGGIAGQGDCKAGMGPANKCKDGGSK